MTIAADVVCYFCSKRPKKHMFYLDGSKGKFPACDLCSLWPTAQKLAFAQIAAGGEGLPLKPPGRSRVNDKAYFIQAGNGGAIKIGWARRPDLRLAELQPGNPSQLVLLGTLPGGVSKEGELHRLFAHSRIRGEWFKPTSELLAYIHDHCANTRTTEETCQSPN